jgi:hypothetical protein
MRRFAMKQARGTGRAMLSPQLKWKCPMRVPPESDWNPIESAPFDEDVALQVTDGRGKPYPINWPCRRTAAGWINSRRGNALEGTPLKWRPYSFGPRR